MIKNIRIQNFKSIKDLTIDAKRVNIFIGAPNAGKSNILEAIAMFSIAYLQNLKDIIRYDEIYNLFYDKEPQNKIYIELDKLFVRATYDERGFLALELREKSVGIDRENRENKVFVVDDIMVDKNGNSNTNARFSDFDFIKYYKFKELDSFNYSNSNSLQPPFGSNLPQALYACNEARLFVGKVINEHGTKLRIDQIERKISEQKDKDEFAILNFPYQVLSDGIKRLMFYLTAIESNSNSTILLEEPETHLFPFYASVLAEKIADKKDNQFFIATHNHYFLTKIMSELNQSEIAIHIIYYKDFQTKVKTLSETEIQEIFDSYFDAFFNLEKFIDE